MAVRTISNAGGNYNATGTRVEGVVPTSADDVVATATSGQLTINTTSSAKSFVLTNYTNTVTWNANLTVAGNVTLAGNHTGTAGTLIVNTASTLTSNGITLPCKMTFSGIVTFTLADNRTVDGLVTTGGTVGTQTLNGFALRCNSSFTCGTTTTHLVTGTTVLTFYGSANGTRLGTGYLRLAININKSGGTLTAGGNISRQPSTGTTTFTYTAGTVSRGAYIFNCLLAGTWDTDRGGGNHLTFSLLGIIGTQTLTTDLYCTTLRLTGTGTFAGAGKVNGDRSITNLVFLPTTTTVWTMTADMTCTNLTLPPATYQITINGYNLYINGDITGTGSALTLGTTTFRYTGTGLRNITGTDVIRNNFIINTAGTLTLGANIYYNTGTLTYTAGTIDVNTNSTHINISAATILNVSGMPINNITFVGGATVYSVTLNSTLVADSIWLNYYSVSFIGNYTRTCNKFILIGNITAGDYIALKAGQEYIVNQEFRIYSSAIYPFTIKSGTPGTKALLTFNGSIQRVINCDATDIDSSHGNKIRSLAGTISNSDNRGESNASIVPQTISKIAVR